MKTKLLVGMAVILVTLLACSSASNTGTVVTNSEQEAQEQAPAQHFKVGEIVKVGDGWQITVNKVSLSQGSEYLKPKPGNVYLVINVTAKNISKEEQTLSSILNFTLKDADGQKYTLSLGGTDKASLDGKVPAGDQMKGDLSYEVPVAQKAFTLAFEAEIFAKGQTIWDITI